MTDKMPPQLHTSLDAVRSLEAMPSPPFSNWEKASDKELREHVLELRLWLGHVVLWQHRMVELIERLCTEKKSDSLPGVPLE